jgi:hypothetical protein
MSVVAREEYLQFWGDGVHGASCVVAMYGALSDAYSNRAIACTHPRYAV